MHHVTLFFMIFKILHRAKMHYVFYVCFPRKTLNGGVFWHSTIKNLKISYMVQKCTSFIYIPVCTILYSILYPYKKYVESGNTGLNIKKGGVRERSVPFGGVRICSYTFEIKCIQMLSTAYPRPQKIRHR